MPVIVNTETCNGCGTCEDNCPTGAIHVENKIAVVKTDECIDCNICVDGCSQQSIDAK